MRLDKLLSHSGLGSRKDVKKIISAGQISVNNETTKKPGLIVDPENDTVKYLNEVIHYQEFYYIMLNKPEGIISATEDIQYQTVVDWVELDYNHVDLFPVGRLDIDTTGFILLTNDGQLAHRILSPKKKVPKTYEAKVAGLVGEADIKRFKQGLNLGDFTTEEAVLTIIETNSLTNESLVEVTITEGKFHQVKRMFEAVDKTVLELHRKSIGSLLLDPALDLGDYRELTKSELESLQAN